MHARTALLRPLLRPTLPLLRRNVTVHPITGGNPFLAREANRALPDINSPRRRMLISIPIFVLAVTGSALAIFNYQKASSSVVNSTLYSLRVNPRAREVLGDEIQFKSYYPIIWGQLNQLKGKINISYAVKGTKGEALMRFRSVRRSRMGLFDTEEWSLTTKDGKQVVLLEGAESLPKSE